MANCELRHVDVGRGHRDRRPYVPMLGETVGEGRGDEMAPGIERDDLRRIRPLPERSDRRHRRRIGEIGHVDRAQLPGGDRERAIERVGPGMGADHVAVRIVRGRDERPARGRALRPPGDRLHCPAAARVGRQDNVLLHRYLNHGGDCTLTESDQMVKFSLTAEPHFCHSRYSSRRGFNSGMMSTSDNDILNCGHLSPNRLRARASELRRVAETARDYAVREQLRGLANRYLAIADHAAVRSFRGDGRRSA